jgi:protein-L-isoaspartate O-methyltransferase
VTDWKSRAAALADKLVADGVITEPVWRDAFATTPRHLFVPQFWALNSYNAPDTLVTGDNPAHHDEWLDAIYSDEPLVTRWAPRTATDGSEWRVVTSSASMPTVVAIMLDRLDLHDGQRVLEIGTGTGYNAALLCNRVGDNRVHSIDIDPTLVAEAARRLTRAGYVPQLRGDNAAVLAENTTFDRIVATCAVNRIPPSWVRQLTPGGRLVAPLTFGGALAVLDKTSDDALTGHLDHQQVYFMPLRGAPEEPTPPNHAFDLPVEPPATAGYRGTTDIDPHLLEDPDFWLWLSLHLPASQVTHSFNEEGTTTSTIVYTTDDRTTASYQHTREGLWPVTQHGRRLWDTVEAAARAWYRTGEPSRDRLGLTVHLGAGQHVWLDDPGSDYIWPLDA